MNGEIQVGDRVISTPDDDYACLIGTVTSIDILGTAQHETENTEDDVHVNFDFDYSPKRITEIEDMFTALYNGKRNYAECPLDEAIMPPSCLIRITDMTDDLLSILLDSGYEAACYCYRILSSKINQDMN